ncbi:LPS-assembly lipoprotein [Ectothiorhodosinus mongolicus]|uniref:LPS-assembly lipoprotein LptE n=1 Tax=Ectothiorhodosinus mongolicus TaxID=233100 RepID=A0A1R3VP80_9GAMM|nr:LPS assembly lipoprotein LptE [Ectothiorhodosinus mongolicus]ULX56600.1 hypothetical protein CKX93_02075 [Ectothiorhodosinus mongolicus]SIT66457.1 LPS-assembly lipoprotein [Ectothiorhodosinus mongolicus]
MRRLTALLTVLVVLLLAGCGFQLRGVGVLPAPLQQLQITGLSSGDPLYRELERGLNAQGATVVPGTQASAVLRFRDFESGRRVVSVGRDGRVNEYELFLRFTYEVAGINDEFELEPVSLNLSRDYQFDAEQILSRDVQESTLQEAMRRDAVQLIMLRLRTAQF